MVDNSNILTEGLKQSGTDLSFYSNKINRSNIIPVELLNTETSTEIVTPDGTFRYEIYLSTPAGFIGNGGYQIVINGITYEVNNFVGGDNKFLIFEKKGQPYLLVKDTIQITNNLGIGQRATFYLFFDRVMFNNE